MTVPPGDLDALLAALETGDERSMRDAGAVLAERPDPRAGAALISAYRRASHVDAEPFLGDLVEARRTLRTAIARLHGSLPFDVLRNALDDDDEQVRGMAAEAIARSGSPRAFDVLHDAARREVGALGRHRGLVALADVLVALAGLDPGRAPAAIDQTVTAVLRWRDGAGAGCEDAGADAWRWFAQEVLRALRACGREATPVMVRLLATGSLHDAAIALRQHGDARAVESLMPWAGVAEVDAALSALVDQAHPGARDWADWWARRGRFFGRYTLGGAP